MTRREFLGRAAGVAACAAVPQMGWAQQRPDYSLTIGPCTLEASPKHVIKTLGYNGTIPGPLLRLREGRPVRIEVLNNSRDPEIVHWHGLKIPSAMDGAMEEG